MEATDVTLDPESSRRYWLRVLRPLGWWLLLVLALYGCRKHQQMMGKTRLTFAVNMAGKPVEYEASASLDGRRIESGDLVSLGRHEFTVTHPKAKSFSTNLFIWYGGRNFGNIALERGTGTLAVDSTPSAALLTITGPEFSRVLTNSTGLTSSVPTDRYVVEAKYQHWEETHEVAVTSDSPGNLHFTPRLGVLQLECNHAGASFELHSADSTTIAAGNLPATVADVPEGTYHLVANHHGNLREGSVTVKAAVTNGAKVEFVYGAAVFETEPPGARVLGRDGRDLGVTPLTLAELPPGAWEFTLQLPGYDLVALPMQIKANQTNAFSTNLVSTSYTGAMKAARGFMAAGEYERAAQAVDEALRVMPDDPPAKALQREAVGLGDIRWAETMGKQGNYASGIKALESALKALPENEEARQMLASFKQRSDEQAKKKRQQRKNRGTELFEAVLRHQTDADLFDSHELKTTMPVKDVHRAILAALRTPPAFRITGDDASDPGTFAIEAREEFTTLLATSSGRRICVIVGAQTADDETQILFKVLEYKTEAVNKFSIGAVLGTPVEVKYVPISSAEMGKLSDKLKAQLNEGVSKMNERIQLAIRQAQAKQQ